MATSSFYNDNLYRTYPLVTSDASAAFPHKRLVGAKVLCSFGSPYQSFPTATLVEWTVRSSQHRLLFLCKAGETTVPVPVIIPTQTGLFGQVFSEVVEETRIRVTVGDLDRETQSISGLDLPLEPTCVLWLKHRGVRSIHLGNASRERVLAVLDECSTAEQRTAYQEADWWRQETEIAGGPFLLAEGYNCSLVSSVVENSIRFQPQAGAGRGVVSEFLSLGFTLVGDRMVPEISEENPFPDDCFLRPDGLPRHDRILRSFCGLGGPEITAVTGKSVQVRNDLDSSTVSIRTMPPGKNEC